MRDKTIVITGAFGSLGMATARAAVRMGARVGLIGRSPPAPGVVPAELSGPNALLLSGIDLAEADSARSALDAIRKHSGVVDVLINAAGSFRWQTVADGDPAVWDEQFRTNLKSAVNACKAAIPHLRASSGG